MCWGGGGVGQTVKGRVLSAEGHSPDWPGMKIRADSESLEDAPLCSICS